MATGNNDTSSIFTFIVAIVAIAVIAFIAYFAVAQMRAGDDDTDNPSIDIDVPDVDMPNSSAAQ